MAEMPMPATAPAVIYNGAPAPHFGAIAALRRYPDVRSFRRKFGLVIPATNTSMEHELWSIILGNRGFNGIGVHTSAVMTPSPRLDSPEALDAYRAQFVGGLRAAVEAAVLARPHHLIMGMSLEHVLDGVDRIRTCVAEIQAPVPWATWHDAVDAALRKYRARRIGLVTPFDAHGNRQAVRMFDDLGYHVVGSVGFSCANAADIAHVPDWAKQRAILELLATAQNQLDAVVQCGSNMSFVQVAEALEPVIGIPVLGINAVTFWHALRQAGIEARADAAGRLFREF
jgi:maleate isomerase